MFIPSGLKNVRLLFIGLIIIVVLSMIALLWLMSSNIQKRYADIIETEKTRKQQKLHQEQKNSNSISKSKEPERILNKLHYVNESRSKYAVDTPGCKIPLFEPFDEQVVAYYFNYSKRPYNCETNNTIRAFRFNDYGLKISWKNNIHNTSLIPPNCYGQPVKHYSDTKYTVAEEEPFNHEGILYYPDEIAVIINCYQTKDKNKIIYTESIPLIPVITPSAFNRVNANQDAKAKQKDKKEDDEESGDDQVPNVLLLGIDSLARTNFERTCVKTLKLIKEKGFISLYGYNKVGVNTFPNLVPLFTGHTPNELGFDEILSENFDGFDGFDDWPFVWKKFAERGHTTLWAESWPETGAFNYMKPGFNKQPFDYYLRPWSLSIRREIREAYSASRTYCYQDSKEIQIYYSYALDFVRAITQRAQQFFTSFYLGRIAHDWLNNAYYVDQPLDQLLNHLFDEQLLNNTIVFLFGDHGLQFGSYVWGTLMGQMEARLPLMSIYLPPKYRKEKWMRNLKINQNRLTSNYDIHATLMQLSGNFAVGTKGISLFQEIGANRTCRDAGIPPEYCCCLQLEPVTDKHLTDTLVQFIIQTLNGFIEPVSYVCQKLSLLRVVSIYEHQYQSTHIIDEERIFSVVIQVSPSKGYFHSTIKVTVKTEQEKKMSKHVITTSDIKFLGDVIRVDKYGNQSHCVQPSMPHRFLLKNICLCKDITIN